MDLIEAAGMFVVTWAVAGKINSVDMITATGLVDTAVKAQVVGSCSKWQRGTVIGQRSCLGSI